MDTGHRNDGADGADGADAHGGGPGGGGPGRTGGPDGGGADAVALLRERLRRADEAIGTPPGLWARVRETPPERRAAPLALRRRPYATAFVVAAAVAAVALGVWWAVRPGAAPPRPAAPPTVPVAVYNTEPVCRGSHTLECALRLAKDPYRRYADRDNAAGRVWHGDVLAARCVVTDGVMVRDEQGLTSTRWYRVRTARGMTGWLPGVRTRNTREVPVCTARESKL
ncbi:hypothetical protein [Streptomyces catenulae]|uniref:Serine/threonine protein kinase n=1 Tax=Streptomyces catenulae TaxID=66875 RepID=A0ABV2Z4A4_9ACTN|nr:hypothetical protein [Streptomyces catenulae]